MAAKKKGKKRAPRQDVPKRAKDPSQIEQTQTIAQRVGAEFFQWTAQTADFDFDCGWQRTDLRTFVENALRRLQSLETMKWGEIEGPKHHPLDREQLSAKAQRRLRELTIDTEVFSVRVDKQTRVIGHREGPLLYVLWLDDQHEICPGVGARN